MPNKASPRCREMIKNEEGWKLVPYICPAGKWTVSAGVRLYPDDKVQGLTYIPLLNRWIGKITDQIAENLFSRELAKCEKALDDLVRVPLNQSQVDALISFIYNVGRPAFAGSTMLLYLNQRLNGTAAMQFKRWVHDDHGVVVPGLVLRRQREMELFKRGQIET